MKNLAWNLCGSFLLVTRSSLNDDVSLLIRGSNFFKFSLSPCHSGAYTRPYAFIFICGSWESYVLCFSWHSFLWLLPTGGRNPSIFMSRNFGYRVVPINCNFSGPAERVRFLACWLIGNYLAAEYHHYYQHAKKVNCWILTSSPCPNVISIVRCSLSHPAWIPSIPNPIPLIAPRCYNHLNMVYSWNLSVSAAEKSKFSFNVKI